MTPQEPPVLAEGKTKIVQSTPNPKTVRLVFKDNITALDGEKHDLLPRKGEINAAISAQIFKDLKGRRIPNHYLRLVEPNIMETHKLKMIPLEVACRNLAAGHFLKNFPNRFKRGEPLKFPIVEFYLKDDKLHDPLLTEDHIVALGYAKEREVATMKRITRSVNLILKRMMEEKGLILADFKLEFGRGVGGKLMIGDEINLDSMRLWDKATGRIVDKDIYRQGGSLTEVEATYREGYRRILGRDLP